MGNNLSVGQRVGRLLAVWLVAALFLVTLAMVLERLGVM